MATSFAIASDYSEDNALDLVAGGAAWTPSVNIDYRLYNRSTGTAIDSVVNATNTINETGHGLGDGTPLLLSSTVTLPAGLSAQTRYYKLPVDANSFQLSLRPGGAVVTFSDDGTGTHSYHLALNDAAGGASEVSGGGYISILQTNNLTNFPAGAAKSNGVAVAYADPSGAWGDVSEMALWDDEGTPNLLSISVLNTLKSIVGTTTDIGFAIGAVTIQWENAKMFDYLRALLIDHQFGSVDITPATNLYMALCDSLPVSTETGTTIDETTGTAYARPLLANNLTNFPAAVSGSKDSLPFVFATPGAGGWGTPTHWAICDALTAGNALFFGAIDTPVLINQDDTVEHIATLTLR